MISMSIDIRDIPKSTLVYVCVPGTPTTDTLLATSFASAMLQRTHDECYDIPACLLRWCSFVGRVVVCTMAWLPDTLLPQLMRMRFCNPQLSHPPTNLCAGVCECCCVMPELEDLLT